MYVVQVYVLCMLCSRGTWEVDAIDHVPSIVAVVVVVEVVLEKILILYTS